MVRREWPGLLPRLWLCHPDVDELARLRPYDETVRLVNSTRLSRMKEGPERRAANLSGLGIDAVNLHHTDWTGGLTTLFHRFRRVCFGWDLQFEHQLRPALRMGIDGVFSDHVDVMVDAFRAELGVDLTRAAASALEPLPVGLGPEHDEGPADEVVLVDRCRWRGCPASRPGCRPSRTRGRRGRSPGPSSPPQLPGRDDLGVEVRLVEHAGRR